MSSDGAEEDEANGAGASGDGLGDDDFDLYGDIDMDLVSSRPISQATRSGSLPSTSGRRAAPPPPRTQTQQPSAGRPAAHPGPVSPPQPKAPLPSPPVTKPVPNVENAAPLQQSVNAKGAATSPAVPQAAVQAPLTSAALASEYMARHGLAPGGQQAAQQQQRPTPQAGKEPTQVYVGELNWWTSDEEIEGALAEYGRVKELRLFEEKANGKFKGYCQADFFDSEAAKACKEKMNGRVFTGRPCVVTFVSAARPRNDFTPPEQEHRMRGRGEAGRGAAGRGDFAEPGPASTRVPMHAGREGYMGGRGMGPQGWDRGFGGGKGGYQESGWGGNPYQQWGGGAYGGGRGEMGPEYWGARAPGGFHEGQGEAASSKVLRSVSSGKRF